MKHLLSLCLFGILSIYCTTPAKAQIFPGLDRPVREWRNDHLPHFHYCYDDYIQFLPGAVMMGLKAGGVEGRSSWRQMLITDAMACAMLFTVVQGTKYITNVERPDASNNHSFPSGHTATAFMLATMLHKEYGQRSIWYSIGGYSVATLTGLSRIANNRHWASDVIVGAGVGILCTELSYYLSKKLFTKQFDHTAMLVLRNY